jgi:hypothetical protein
MGGLSDACGITASQMTSIAGFPQCGLHWSDQGDGSLSCKGIRDVTGDTTRAVAGVRRELTSPSTVLMRTDILQL